MFHYGVSWVEDFVNPCDYRGDYIRHRAGESIRLNLRTSYFYIKLDIAANAEDINQSVLYKLAHQLRRRSGATGHRPWDNFKI